METFIGSAYNFTLSFAKDLLAESKKNPKLNVEEFTKRYFGLPVEIKTPVGVKVTKKTPVAAAAPRKKGANGKEKCTAITAKGTKCSKCAVKDEVFCSIHLKSKPAKQAAPAPAPKKVVPVHNHTVTRTDKDCNLCETHGNVLQEEEDEEDVEVAVTKKIKELNADPDYAFSEEEFEED